MGQFVELLFNVQPWMTNADLMDILQSPQLQQHNVVCQGCGAKNSDNNTVWVCHIAVKVMLLSYFVVDMYTDGYESYSQSLQWRLANSTLLKLEWTLRRHHCNSCKTPWDVNESARNIHLMGRHFVP